MDLLGSARLGYGKVLLVGVQRPQCSPKHHAFDSSGGWGDTTTSISSPGQPRTSHSNRRERTNRRLRRQPSKKYSTSRCFAQRSSRARGRLGGWLQKAMKHGASPKKSHQRSQSTGCVRVRKAQTNPCQNAAQQIKVDGDGTTHHDMGANVKSTWPGCEDQSWGPVTLASLEGHRRRQRGLWG